MEKDSSQEEKIEIKTRPDADMKTRAVASQLSELFNGPLFEKMVMNAVEEMILEGKLEYDMENDELGVPEDIVKAWAKKMEETVWSKN